MVTISINNKRGWSELTVVSSTLGTSAGDVASTVAGTSVLFSTTGAAASDMANSKISARDGLEAKPNGEGHGQN